MNVEKEDLKDLIKTIFLSSCAMLGLFAFFMLYGIIFMDYDPRIMLEGIRQDLAMLFS